MSTSTNLIASNFCEESTEAQKYLEKYYLIDFFILPFIVVGFQCQKYMKQCQNQIKYAVSYPLQMAFLNLYLQPVLKLTCNHSYSNSKYNIDSLNVIKIDHLFIENDPQYLTNYHPNLELISYIFRR